MIFDTHAHYDDEQFEPDREELLNSLHASGICGIAVVSAIFAAPDIRSAAEVLRRTVRQELGV